MIMKCREKIIVNIIAIHYLNRLFKYTINSYTRTAPAMHTLRLLLMTMHLVMKMYNKTPIKIECKTVFKCAIMNKRIVY